MITSSYILSQKLPPLRYEAHLHLEWPPHLAGLPAECIIIYNYLHYCKDMILTHGNIWKNKLLQLISVSQGKHEAAISPLLFPIKLIHEILTVETGSEKLSKRIRF